LISDGKTGKYLKYAIGEIVLVVIGILIALQINNWNQDRFTEIQVKANLLNLTEAIKQDYDLLKKIEEINDFRYNSIYQVLKWTKIPINDIDSIPIVLSGKSIWEVAIPETYDPEFFQKTILYIGRPRVMIVQSYAMEEFKSTGLYSQMNNQHLKNLLNEYYAGLEWFFGYDLKSDADDITYLSHYVRDKYNLRLDDIPTLNEPMELIRNDAGFIVRLRNVMSGANWRIFGANTSKMRAEVLLDELKKEINKD